MSWEKTKLIKNNRDKKTYRFTCKVCGKVSDSGKTPTSCRHDLGYNLDRVWKNILRSALGIKSGRSRLKIDIDKRFIEKLYNKQNGKCAISGVDIFLEINASLDRIDSGKGYTKDNVQWVHKDVNIMKGVYSEDYFREVCENVYNKNNSRSDT